MSVTPSSFIGPILLGTVFDWFLLGALIVQLYVYDKNQKTRKDSIWMRLIVYAVTAINIFETVLTTHWLWFYAVDQWGQESFFELRTPPWTGQATGTVTGFIALLVQCTYSWRIWTITRSIFYRMVATVAILVSWLQFGALLATPIYVRFSNSGGPVTPKAFHIFFNLYLGGDFTADCLITICMFTLLLRARAQTIWVHTQTLYDRLIIVTLSTGLLTAGTAGAALGLFLNWPNSNYWYIASLCIGKMYGNSFVAALNDRFFRPDEPMHDFDTERALRTDESTAIGFAQGAGGAQEGGTAVHLRVRPDHAGVNTGSTMMSSVSGATMSPIDEYPPGRSEKPPPTPEVEIATSV
ncbi:unnamed protein product [Peniophora sp. CBMAI 1063]|nr:unnamed protein product [Peniophora sp. CBMAI 1063]